MTIDEAEKIKTVVENKNQIEKLVNAVAKTILEAFENLTIEDVNMYQLGYNKAIDDFTEQLVKKSHYLEGHYGAIYEEDIYKIAEQLKAGGDSE